MNIIQGSFYLKSGNIVYEKIEVGDINTEEDKEIFKETKGMIDSFKMAKKRRKMWYY